MIDATQLGHPWHLPTAGGDLPLPPDGAAYVWHDSENNVWHPARQDSNDKSPFHFTVDAYRLINDDGSTGPVIERSAARGWDVQPDADFIALGDHGRVICSGHADLWRGLSEREVAAWAHVDDLVDATRARAPQPVANSPKISDSSQPQPSSRPAMGAEEAEEAFRKAQCDWVDNDDDKRDIADMRRDWFRAHWPVGGAVDVEHLATEIDGAINAAGVFSRGRRDTIAAMLRRHLTDAPRVTYEALRDALAAEGITFWSDEAETKLMRAAARLNGGAK